MPYITLIVSNSHLSDADTLAASLKETGHGVSVALSAHQDNLADHLTQTPDLILFDLLLVREDSSLLRELYETHAWRLPVILLTDPDDRELAIQYMQVEARDFCRWDDPDHLAAIIERELQVLGFRSQFKKVQRERDTLLQRHRTLLETMPTGVFEIDLNGIIRFASSGMHRLFGYSEDALIGKSIARLLQPDERARWSKLIARLSDEYTEPASLQGTFVHRDGSPLEVSLDWNYRYDDEGKVTGFLAVCVDMTGLKRSEKLAQQYNDIFHSLQAGVMVFCKEESTGSWQIRAVNPAGCHLLGRNRQMIESQRLDVALPALMTCNIRDRIEEVHSTGETLHLESIEYCDEVVHDRVWKVDLFLVKPDCVGMAFEDITERNRAMQALRDSEARYRSLIEQSTSGIYLMQDGRLQMVNQRFLELLEITEEEATAPDFDMLAFVDVESRPVFEERARLYLIGEEAPERYEFTLVTKSGKRKIIEAVVSELTVQGEPAVQGIFRDISERKRLAEELAHSQKLEAVGRLAGGMAHEFNNVLTAIDGNLELGMLNLKQDHAAWEDFNEIRTIVGKSATLTQQLLLFNQKRPAVEKVLDVNGLLRDMETMIRKLVGEDVELRLSCKADVSIIPMVRLHMEQIILTLVANAREAMPEGGKLRISTRNEWIGESSIGSLRELLPGGYLRLTVEDAGAARWINRDSDVLDEADVEILEKTGGLGLSTVYALVAQIGGAVRLYSDKTGGGVFELYLPCAGNAPQPVETDSTSGDLAGKGNELILVVEDDETVRDCIRRTLEHYDYKVITAASGEEALERFREQPNAYTLLLTDIVMPGINGLELAETIRAEDQLLPVLYFSGYLQSTLFQDGVLQQNAPYLKKPFSPGELLRKVREVIDT